MTDFALTEEQEMLRDTARQFLSDRVGTDVVRDLMASRRGFDDDLWDRTVQMGWQSMAVPEEHGGSGYGWTEVGLLMEEMGRALLPAPYLSAAVLGAAALRLGGSDEQRDELLAGVAAGEVRPTLADLEPGGGQRPADVRVEAERDGGELVLSGTKDFVLDGHTATHLVVAARTGDRPRDITLVLVPGDADGLDRQRFETLDQTRKQATVHLDGVRVPAGQAVLGEPDGGWPLLQQVRARGAVALAGEQVGGAQRVLDMSVAYGKQRRQFGRAIGSFQAVKHRCADMLVDIESARSAARHAARALDGDDPGEVAVAAPMAKSHCSEVYERAAGDNIQNHGGIGFTWEHDAHLWFKRAKSSKLLLGSPRHWRTRLADALGL